MHARGGKKDFVNLHNVEGYKEYDEEEESGIGQRNSEDIVINRRGEELVELCKSLNMVILNGRRVGDPWGKMTSHQYNGSAVVDYVIVSVNLLSSIGNFLVGDFSAWVSDHCNLLYELNVVHDIPIEKEILSNVPKSFRFKEGIGRNSPKL